MKKLFSEQEIRGLLLFLPLAGLAIAALLLAQPRSDIQEAIELEAAAEAEREAREALPPEAREQRLLEERTFQLHPFDPNTVTYEELLQMGLTKREAYSLVNYRKNGKIFRIAEDVALTYNYSNEFYQLLKPYIRIAQTYAPQPQTYTHSRYERKRRPLEPFRLDTASAVFLYDTGIVTWRQAENIVRRRQERGIWNMYELRECYGINDSIAAVLEPYVIFPEREPDPFDQPVDLNRADSAGLCRVNGIGSVTAGRIVAYREQLGGFVSVEQLSEIPGITESNYEKIVKQIFCDCYEIQKIDINFADPKVLARHPYIREENLRRLVKIRQLKGGWTSVEELIEDHIFTREEAEKLAPYLLFREKTAEPTKN